MGDHLAPRAIGIGERDHIADVERGRGNPGRNHQAPDGQRRGHAGGADVERLVREHARGDRDKDEDHADGAAEDVQHPTDPATHHCSNIQETSIAAFRPCTVLSAVDGSFTPTLR